MAASVDFRWSEHELSIKRLLLDSLPVIVLVTSDHYDKDEDEDIGSGEMYRIFGTTPCGRYMLAHSIANGDVVPCIQDPQMEAAWSNGQISLEDIPDRLKGSVSIPTHIPLSVKVCIGLEGGSSSEYQQLLENYHMTTLPWGTDPEEQLYGNVMNTGKQGSSTVPKEKPTLLVRPSVEEPKTTLKSPPKKIPPKPSPKPKLKPVSKATIITTESVTTKDPSISAADPVTTKDPSISAAGPGTTKDPSISAAGPVTVRNVSENYEPEEVPPAGIKSGLNTNFQMTSADLKPQPVSPIQCMRTEYTPLMDSTRESSSVSGSGPQENSPKAQSLRASIYSSRSIPYEPPNNSNTSSFPDLASVPQDISNLSVTQLSDCLSKLKLESYTEKFAENHVDGALLKSLEDKAELTAMMSEHFSMTKMESHRLWMFTQKNWRPKLN